MACRHTLSLLCLLPIGSALAVSPDPTAPGPAVANATEGARIARRVGCDGCHGAGGIGQVFMETPEQGRIVAPNLTQRRELYTDAGWPRCCTRARRTTATRPGACRSRVSST